MLYRKQMVINAGCGQKPEAKERVQEEPYFINARGVSRLGFLMTKESKIQIDGEKAAGLQGKTVGIFDTSKFT